MGGQNNLENIIKASHGCHIIHINKVLQALNYFNLIFNRQLVPYIQQERYDIISVLRCYYSKLSRYSLHL